MDGKLPVKMCPSKFLHIYDSMLVNYTCSYLISYITEKVRDHSLEVSTVDCICHLLGVQACSCIGLLTVPSPCDTLHVPMGRLKELGNSLTYTYHMLMVSVSMASCKICRGLR